MMSLTPQQMHLAQRTCVIGEADPFLAQLLQRFVEKSGLRARLAPSGEAILTFTSQDRPDLIVLDPELPGKVRGWQVLQTLDAADDTRHIPVILCTWLNEAESQALVGQALNQLQKPELHYYDFLQALSAVGVSSPGGKE